MRRWPSLVFTACLVLSGAAGCAGGSQGETGSASTTASTAAADGTASTAPTSRTIRISESSSPLALVPQHVFAAADAVALAR